jgi:hypothetical protein
MTTDWVLVMVSSSCKSDVDAFPASEHLQVARKDPDAEKTARGTSSPLKRVGLPLTALAKSKEPLLSKAE